MNQSFVGDFDKSLCPNKKSIIITGFVGTMQK